MSIRALLAHDTVATRRPLPSTMRTDGKVRGAVVGRLPGRGYRRAEQGSHGPLLLEVKPDGRTLRMEVWGPPETPDGEAEAALVATRRWAGLHDDLDGFVDLVSASPTLRQVLRHVGAPIIGAMPRASESFGRGVLGQLVQGVEAMRSTRELVAMCGTPAAEGLWAWPTREQLGSAPAYQLRRCGIALRSAQALHAFVVEEARMQALAQAQAWDEMDRSLRRFRGIGAWTSAETRLHLGDPDAVSVGDYHLPALVGWSLGEREEDDASMLRLLEPYRPHRGRVLRMLEHAAARGGLIRTKPRRGARQALSAHRYW